MKVAPIKVVSVTRLAEILDVPMSRVEASLYRTQMRPAVVRNGRSYYGVQAARLIARNLHGQVGEGVAAAIDAAFVTMKVRPKAKPAPAPQAKSTTSTSSKRVKRRPAAAIVTSSTPKPIDAFTAWRNVVNVIQQAEGCDRVTAAMRAAKRYPDRRAAVIAAANK